MPVITFNTVPSNALASGIFIEQQPGLVNVATLNLPENIALFGQVTGGKTPTWNQPQLLLSPADAVTYYGAGSQLHVMANAAFAGCGSVPVYAFPIQDGAGVAASGTIGVGGPATSAGTISLYIAGKLVQVSVASGDTATTIATNIATAISAATLYAGAPAGSLPVSANAVTTTVTCTCRWKGITGNNITMRQDIGATDARNEPAGVVLTIATTLSAGTLDPDPTTALGNMGSRWYTWIAYPYQQATALTTLASAYATRFGAGVMAPFCAVIGSVLDSGAFISLVNALNTPYCYLPVQGSPNLPEEIASAAVGACAASAQSDPYRPFRNLKLPNILPGTIADWPWTTKNTVETNGGATVNLNADGSVSLNDMVTTYKTNSQGAVDPSWQYLETISNIQAKMYSMATMFKLPPYDRAIVVDDTSVSNKPYVVSPKSVKAAMINLIDNNWILNAGSKNRASIVGSLITLINVGNAGRIDVNFVDTISAGLRIIAVAYQWSFFPVNKVS